MTAVSSSQSYAKNRSNTLHHKMTQATLTTQTPVCSKTTMFKLCIIPNKNTLLEPWPSECTSNKQTSAQSAFQSLRTKAGHSLFKGLQHPSPSKGKKSKGWVDNTVRMLRFQFRKAVECFTQPMSWWCHLLPLPRGFSRSHSSALKEGLCNNNKLAESETLR